MQITAKLKYLRIAPRKIRLVADLIRDKTVEEAQNILRFTAKKGATPLLKLLKEGIANAKNNFQLEEGNLYIQRISVDDGPKYKRWQPRARGSATEIQKKSSHLILILDEIEKKTKKKIKKVEKAEDGRRVEEDKSSSPPSAAARVKEEKKTEKPKFKPETEIAKPRTERGKRKFFQRKVF